MNKTFTSIDNKHSISIEINETNAFMNILYIEYSCPKSFVILLKDITEYLTDNNIAYIYQYIMERDYTYFNNSSIEYTDIIKKEYLIKTKIQDFILEICNALDIKRL